MVKFLKHIIPIVNWTDEVFILLFTASSKDFYFAIKFDVLSILCFTHPHLISISPIGDSLYFSVFWLYLHLFHGWVMLTIHFSHIGLLAIPWTCQVCSHFWAFSVVVPCAWDALNSFVQLCLLIKYQLHREAFLDCLICSSSFFSQHSISL